MRLSDYLRTKLGFSSALITKVKFGGISVNGQTVTARYPLKDGDRLCVTLLDERSENIPPMDIPLDIIYEDEHILAVNKPKNMPTHPSRGNSLPTLANAVMAYFGESFTFRAISRLDRDTSGIVIIAKNAFSSAILGRDMKEGRFTKIYTARVSGIPSVGTLIDAPIAREAEGSVKRVVREGGKRALTEIIRVTPVGENSVCQIKLHTGRTHQIRVHLAYIGHPLVGDFLYGEPLKCGYFLHCSKLCFPHPTSREIITLKSECNKDFYV